MKELKSIWVFLENCTLKELESSVSIGRKLYIERVKEQLVENCTLKELKGSVSIGKNCTLKELKSTVGIGRTLYIERVKGQCEYS